MAGKQLRASEKKVLKISVSISTSGRGRLLYPQPSDWEESEESLQAQEERRKMHKRQTEAME